MLLIFSCMILSFEYLCAGEGPEFKKIPGHRANANNVSQEVGVDLCEDWVTFLVVDNQDNNISSYKRTLLVCHSLRTFLEGIYLVENTELDPSSKDYNSKCEYAIDVKNQSFSRIILLIYFNLSIQFESYLLGEISQKEVMNYSLEGECNIILKNRHYKGVFYKFVKVCGGMRIVTDSEVLKKSVRNEHLRNFIKHSANNLDDFNAWVNMYRGNPIKESLRDLNVVCTDFSVKIRSHIDDNRIYYIIVLGIGSGLCAVIYNTVFPIIAKVHFEPQIVGASVASCVWACSIVRDYNTLQNEIKSIVLF